jgi:hydroxyacylglutathione hydrolase
MKLTEKIHLLQIDFEIVLSPEKKLPRFVNVIIIFSDDIILIDTGVKGSEKIISEYFRLNNRDINEISTIILSHSHPDHIGSAAKIRELTGCKILAHQAEKEWFENIELQNSQRPVPGFFNLADRPVKIDEFISDKQEIKVEDGLTIKFIHSPGHSKGSLNIQFKEDRILFTADSIPLKNDIPNYDSYFDLMNSLSSIRDNDQYDTLLTSWTIPLKDRKSASSLIDEGEDYIELIDNIVKECYSVLSNLEACKCTVDKLGLPSFLVNPIVDKAFRSHL